ncbi:hypothetical protein ACK6D9_11625 [Hoeflea sp. Naph1]|uniref:hypothetical protein n=1 Tax=Hoeflea sp. Naph1 TaxID=3388653 RepID=UPI00398FC3A2
MNTQNQIEITRWQPLNHDGAGIASFNFRIRGVTVRAALFARDGDGYRIGMPFTRHVQNNGMSLTSVGLDYDDRQAVTAAAVAYHEKIDGGSDDAGLRRVIGETMELAGL